MVDFAQLTCAVNLHMADFGTSNVSDRPQGIAACFYVIIIEYRRENVNASGRRHNEILSM